jgi:tRNA pseudouridine55 synthase
MDALLLIDKPPALTSHDVVARVRRITGEKSVGHLGTLDPLATGLLPLVLGCYTRLARFFGPLPKTYTGSIRFGFATDTWDSEGTPATAQTQPQLTLAELRAAAEPMLGTHLQTPPPFSAKKVNGKPAYALARAGQAPELRPVPITVHSFQLHELHEATVTFTLQISSGGYVRALAHALGQQLGCGAHLASLRRTEAGPFSLASALTLETLTTALADGTLPQHLPHPRMLLPELPPVTADAATLTRLRNGMQMPLPEFSSAPHVKVFATQGELVAIARRVAGVLFQPVAVLR